jgi:hypothetical protein
MIPFLIEILILGILFAHLFSKRLPDIFLGLISPLLGLILYALNVLALLILHIKVDLIALVILMSGEIIALLLYQIIQKKFSSITAPIYKIFLGVSVACIGLAYFFYKFNYSFASNDTLIMIIYARNILETGLSKWYFASPSGMGILIPIFQTLGLLFGNEYTWFLQPVISIIFFSLFIYFCYRSLKKYHVASWLAFCLPIILVGVMASSNIVLVFTTYIHTNFDSALFLFLSVISLVSYFEDNNENWLVFTTIFLIIFGLTRVENVFYAILVILVFLADGKMPFKKRLTTFLPYLVFQFLWCFLVLTLRTNIPSDQISPEMMVVVLAGILGVGLMTLFSEKKWIKPILTRYLAKFFPILLFIPVLVVLLLSPTTTLANIVTITENMFIIGLWWSLWWFILILFIVTKIFSPRVNQELNYLNMISAFFVMVIFLGYFREPYRLSWADSANRMFVHILPIVLIYLLDKLGIWFEKSKSGIKKPALDS